MGYELTHPLTALTLTIPADQTFDQWVEMGKSLAVTEKVLGWYIGDWWLARKPDWGHAADAAAQNIWGLSYSTLRQYGAVAGRFKNDKRLSNLPFTHFLAVTSLPVDEAETILHRAAEESLSNRELRRAVEDRKVELELVLPRDVAAPDPDYDGFKNIARSYNREDEPSRLQVLQSLEDMGKIMIVNEDLAEDIPL